ncbi:MAG: hypothetical protein JSY10_17900 [Paenibacillus sp.]|nr:hypothetical protein [Paenibacillus sp.]
MALASIMVTFSSAKPLNKENPVTGILPGFDNQDFHQKRATVPDNASTGEAVVLVDTMSSVANGIVEDGGSGNVSANLL